MEGYWYNITVSSTFGPTASLYHVILPKIKIADPVSVLHSYIKLHFCYKCIAVEWWTTCLITSLKPLVVPQLLLILHFSESSVSRALSGNTYGILENGAWLTAFPSHHAVFVLRSYLLPFVPGRLYGVKRACRLGPNYRSIQSGHTWTRSREEHFPTSIFRLWSYWLIDVSVECKWPEFPESVAAA